MQPVLYALDDRLANAGDTVSYAGHLNEDSYELGEHEFSLPMGIDFDLVLTNAGEGILVTGMLRADAVGTCDRCLEDAHLSLNAEVDEYYLFEEPVISADDEDEADYVLVNADKTTILQRLFAFACYGDALCCTVQVRLQGTLPSMRLQSE